MHNTEEGQKVARLGGKKYFAVYERFSDDEIQANLSPLAKLFEWLIIID